MNKKHLEDKINEQANYWYSCKKEGLKSFQKEPFEIWLEESDTHRKAYKNLEKLERICTSFDDDYIDSLEAEVLKEAQESKSRSSFKYIGAAAVFILAVFVSAFEVYDNFAVSYEKSYITQTKPIQELILEDGTKLALDARTKIKIEFYKNERRAELLAGQVMFEVAKDKNRPFIISSNYNEIQVLGTSFEVKNSEEQTKVKVLEGRVKVSSLNNDNKIVKMLSVLGKGDEVSLDKEGEIISLGKTKVENIALWRDNKILFEKVSIKEASKELSKYIENKIQVEEEIAQLNITGKFFITKPKKFFEAISAIHPISIKSENNLITISKKK